MAWTEVVVFAISYTVNDVAYGNGLWVAVATSGQLKTSTDGTSWTARTSGFGTSAIYCAHYCNNQWIIGGASGKIATSSDGTTWTQRTGSLGSAAYIGFAYGAGLYVGVSSYGAINSADGVTWSSISALAAKTFNGIAYGNGIFVALSNTGLIFTSTDGAIWTQRSTSFSSMGDIYFDNGQFVIVGDNSKSARSTDGIDWTNTNTGMGGYVVDVVYGAGRWLTVGGAGLVRVSFNSGATWSTDSDSLTFTFNACGYGNSMFVIGGTSGKIGYQSAVTPVQLTPTIGTIAVIGRDWTRPYADTAQALDIGLTGSSPKTHLDTYKRAPSQAIIDVVGFDPELVLGLAMTPAQRTIALDGQTGVFANRLLYLISPDWVKTRYRCVLTGATDDLVDVELPLKSFQTRFTDNYIYFSAVLPGVDQFQDAIADRPNGRLVVWRIYDYLDGHDERFVLASVPFETLRVDSGGRSGLTGTLSGNEYNTSVTPQIIELFDPVYYAATDGVKRRYRCRLDPRLRVGDTAVIEDDSLTVGTIIHIVDVKSTLMEIAEA